MVNRYIYDPSRNPTQDNVGDTRTLELNTLNGKKTIKQHCTKASTTKGRGQWIDCSNKVTVNNSALLPAHYIPTIEPFYQGPGNHSVYQLEQICEQYKELVHQLRIREQSLIFLFDIELV